MTSRVSSRHEGDLGGRLLRFGENEKIDVTVVVAADMATSAAVQHAAWMLLNLLVRLDGVVRRVGIICPASIPVAGRIVPFDPTETDLRLALIRGAERVGVLPVEVDSRIGPTLVVGARTPVTGADLYVAGEGWWGGISAGLPFSEALSGRSALPFGPYTAASLAAAEIFRLARFRPESYHPVSRACYALLHHRATESPLPDGPTTIPVELDAAIVGVGAVGSAAVHALWACAGPSGRVLLVDNDLEGLDVTNLNRYPLFGRSSVGRWKASEAVRIASDTGIDWVPFDGDVGQLEALPPCVASAVDRNESREAIQNRYPGGLLSASTLDLRAEVLRCGPPGRGACLRCFNPPERVVPDDDLRARLRVADAGELAAMAAAAGVPAHAVAEWAQFGRCGTVGERVLSHLRQQSDQPARFAVGFVSAMAGTMLAAELVKLHLGFSGPLNSDSPRASFQFHSPTARSNRASPYARDPRCPMCRPDGPACRAWARRDAAFRCKHLAAPSCRSLP